MGTALDPHESAGVWDGELEPSFVMHAEVTQPDAENRLAAELGTKYDQDAVVLFRHGSGPDTVQHFALPEAVRAEHVAATMKELGIIAGTIDLRTRSFRLGGEGREHLPKVQALADQLGATLLPEQHGWFKLMARDEYPQWLGGVSKAANGSYAVTIEIGATRMMAGLARLAPEA